MTKCVGINIESDRKSRQNCRFLHRFMDKKYVIQQNENNHVFETLMFRLWPHFPASYFLFFVLQ